MFRNRTFSLTSITSVLASLDVKSFYPLPIRRVIVSVSENDARS